MLFLRVNEGLQRRFPWVFEFPDYSCAELSQMFQLKVKEKGFVLQGYINADMISKLINDKTTAHQRSQLNGGLVDQLFQKAKLELDQSLVGLGFDQDQAVTILWEHVQRAIAQIQV